ncbi:hypothetical protein [Antarctobacter sp.]|uniref:hypothetical protein n=1 Tax=Antarctobacter sp. TaxID=1872577 RepID=UPI002B26CD3A|nr:hypothetical protein [Antarctobacter sp.]
MRKTGFSFLIFLCLGLATPGLAQPEIHVVAVGSGQPSKDTFALPEARVLVDRPGRDVSLVLLDGGILHWKVEATAGTLISDIIRSGPDSTDSKVSLYGIPMMGVQVSGLPLVFNPWGHDFRQLIDSVADRSGTDRISSFQARHKAPAAPLRVASVNTTTAALARDYLSPLLDAGDDLSPDIRNWTENHNHSGDFTVAFDETGVSLTGPSGAQRFPATPGIPPILLPVTGVYDPASQMIYCITVGAEGYLYAVDARTGNWSVITSLDDYDAAGLLYDPNTRQLILTGAFSRPGDIRVFGLDGSRSSVFIPTTGFPGLTDLFDYGNEHGPPLTPHVYRDGWLLLKAVATQDSAGPGPHPHRVYAVQLATGEMRLLRFGND